MKRCQFCTLFVAGALLAPLSVSAENSTSADGYTIHHNAFSTANLTPEVAKAYGIQRSKFRGMLNVSVIQDKEGTTGSSVPARVQASSVPLTGQSSPIPMREIKEQDAIYYVGQFPVQDQETVNFAIEVTPQGAPQTYKIKMDQQFFAD